MALREARSCRVLTKAFPVNNAKVNSKVLKSQLKKGRSPWLPARAGEQSCLLPEGQWQLPTSTDDGGDWEEGAVAEPDTPGAEVDICRSAGAIRKLPAEVLEFLPGQRVWLAQRRRDGRHSCRFHPIS